MKNSLFLFFPVLLLGCAEQNNNDIRPNRMNQTQNDIGNHSNDGFRNILREAENEGGNLSIKTVQEIFGASLEKASEEFISKSKLNLKPGDEVYIVDGRNDYGVFESDDEVYKAIFIYRKDWSGENTVDFIECTSRVVARQEDPNDPTSRWLLSCPEPGTNCGSYFNEQGQFIILFCC